MPKEKERERVKEQLKQPTWHVTGSGHQVGLSRLLRPVGGAWTRPVLHKQRGFNLGPDLTLHQAWGSLFPQFPYYILLVTKKWVEWRKGMGGTEILPCPADLSWGSPQCGQRAFSFMIVCRLSTAGSPAPHLPPFLQRYFCTMARDRKGV